MSIQMAGVKALKLIIQEKNMIQGKVENDTKTRRNRFY